jgi:hypothetical protein
MEDEQRTGAGSKEESEMRARDPKLLAGRIAAGSKALAAIAMVGATPGQSLFVYICYGLIGLAILLVAVPPYVSTKQIAAYVVLAIALFGIAILVIPHYMGLRNPESAVAQAAVAERRQVPGRRRAAVLLVVIAIVGGGYYFYVRTRFSDPLWKLWVTSDTYEDSALRGTIVGAMTARKPYAITSIVMMAEIYDPPGGTSRDMFVHTSYSLRCLRSIAASEEDVFPEQYSTHHAVSIDRWPGSEEEKDGEPTKYQIRFACNKGETRTVVSGATFHYSLPLEPRNEHGIQLGSTEDAIVYRNDSDYIAEVTMIVTSRTTSLKADGNGVVRQAAGGQGEAWTPAALRVVPSGTQHPQAGNRSIAARFVGIQQGETLILRFSW